MEWVWFPDSYCLLFFINHRPLWVSDESYDPLFWKAHLCKYLGYFAHHGKFREFQIRISCFGEKYAVGLPVGKRGATFMK